MPVSLCTRLRQEQPAPGRQNSANPPTVSRTEINPLECSGVYGVHGAIYTVLYKDFARHKETVKKTNENDLWPSVASALFFSLESRAFLGILKAPTGTSTDVVDDRDAHSSEQRAQRWLVHIKQIRARRYPAR